VLEKEKTATNNARNTSLHKGFHMAAAQGHVEVVEALLAGGAAIDVVNRGGHTAL
jgi:ankyrin repeat protein